MFCERGGAQSSSPSFLKNMINQYIYCLLKGQSATSQKKLSVMGIKMIIKMIVMILTIMIIIIIMIILMILTTMIILIINL